MNKKSINIIAAITGLILVVGAAYLVNSEKVSAPKDTNPIVGQDNVEIETEVDLAAGTQLTGTPIATSTDDGQALVGGDAVVSGTDPLSGEVSAEVEAGMVSFTVLGGNYYYDMDEIRVKEGDTVTINFRSVEGFHDWVVDEFDAATDKVQTDGETSVTFVADKKGTFEYYCSVGSHRANGMVGNLIVE